MAMTLRCCTFCGALPPKHEASCTLIVAAGNYVLPTYDELVERAKEKIRAATGKAPSPWATFPPYTTPAPKPAPPPYVQPDTVLTKAVAGFTPKEEPPTKIAIDPNARYVRNLK